METVKKTRKTSELIRIKQLIKICEKNNVSKVKFDNIELEFREKPIKHKKALEKYQGENNKYLEAPSVDMPPDDVMMFAATTHFDEMIETRKKGIENG